MFTFMRSICFASPFHKEMRKDLTRVHTGEHEKATKKCNSDASSRDKLQREWLLNGGIFKPPPPPPPPLIMSQEQGGTLVSVHTHNLVSVHTSGSMHLHHRDMHSVELYWLDYITASQHGYNTIGYQTEVL